MPNKIIQNLEHNMFFQTFKEIFRYNKEKVMGTKFCIRIKYMKKEKKGVEMEVNEITKKKERKR